MRGLGAAKSVIAIALLALVAGACGDDISGGRSAADQAVIDQAVGELVSSGMDRSAAECYVGGLVDEFGVDQIVSIGNGGDLPADMISKAMTLLTDCGISGLDTGTTPASITSYRDLAQPRDQVDGPYTYGDDATLDALWDQCAGGAGSACDQLFFDSAVGSEYEAFGNTCGNRLELDYDCSSLGE
jgi:hypothetical protein